MNYINIKAVGDINLQTKNNSHPFGEIIDTLNKKDILFGNLETVLTDEGIFIKKAVNLSSPPESIQYLKDAGFDIVNLANNHIYDRGEVGLINTVKSIESVGISHIGVITPINNNKYLILEKKGIKIGFLGYTAGRFKNPEKCFINRIIESKIISDIEKIIGLCDIIVVSLHWGIENVHYPSSDQIQMAHNIIDSGASIIIGHHSHVLQGIEEYNKGLIAYSLGNFQFDPELSQSKSNESVILSIDICEKGIHGYEVIPIQINNNYEPELISEFDCSSIKLINEEFREKMNNIKSFKKWWFEEISYEYLNGNLNSYKMRLKSSDLFALLECFIWLMTLFCIKCYFGLIRRKLRNLIL